MLKYSLTFAVILNLLIFSFVHAQDNKTIDAIKLSETVYMLRSNAKIGNPTTVVSIGKDGVLIIDPSIEDFGEVLRNKIKGLGGKDIKLVINTHTHWDHTRGNFNFGNEAIIIGNSELRKHLSKDKGFPPDSTYNLQVALPKLTIDEEIKLYFNGEEIRVIPISPGHTYGDIIVYFTKSKVLVAGDYYFGEGFPVFYYPGGADMENYFDNIEFMLEEFPDDIIITPGHGTFEPKKLKAYSKSEYINWYNIMKESISIIRSKIMNGKSLDEITAKGLPEKFDHYNTKPRFVSTEKWINVVYQYYTDNYKN